MSVPTGILGVWVLFCFLLTIPNDIVRSIAIWSLIFVLTLGAATVDALRKQQSKVWNLYAARNRYFPSLHPLFLTYSDVGTKVYARAPVTLLLLASYSMRKERKPFILVAIHIRTRRMIARHEMIDVAWAETNRFGLRETTRIVVDAEDARLSVRSIMTEKFGPKLQEYGCSCLSQESRFPICAFNARITHALKHAQ